MSDFTEMRSALDAATNGGLHTLNKVCVENGWEPTLIVQPDSELGLTRYIFLATDRSGAACYTNAVTAEPNPLLETALGVWLRIRDVKKTTARIQHGLSRLATGLDVEEDPQPTLH